MPEAIGIEQTMDAANNLNIKSVLDLILTNAVASQKTQQDTMNGHIARVNAIAEASLTSQLKGLNSFDPVEAAAYSRITRTPTGDAKTDVSGAVALAMAMLQAGVKSGQTMPPVSSPQPVV